jgi:hypothetical protein
MSAAQRWKTKDLCYEFSKDAVGRNDCNESARIS